MAQIEYYKKQILKKKEELSKLNISLAQEQTKITSQEKRIISAKAAIGRTKNQSTVKSKLNEIDRANKNIADIRKKCGEIQTKIAKIEKEIVTAEKNCSNEEEKIAKKKQAEEKKRLLEADKQKRLIQSTLTQQSKIQDEIQEEIKKLKEIPEKITVLFLAANPINTIPLRLDEEARTIQQRIRMSEYRESVVFESRWATRSADILQAINETNPTIVHFSGHGTDAGDLVLLNSDGMSKYVSKEAISLAMSTASDSIRLVVFNACFSEKQAESVVEYVDSAIGMSDTINDEAACFFAAQLYSSIGFGNSLSVSFKQAIAQLMLEGIREENIPKLYLRSGVQAEDVILVKGSKE
jgi:predicted  nucleic acid-binding Zn-ribbon protein